MAVGANHHSARKCVVLKHYLVNDSTAWSPETNSVFCRHALQKVVHLFVGVNRDAHVDACAGFRQNEVVAMHGAWHRCGGKSGSHELQQRHLRSCVLHGNSVWGEVCITATAFHFLCLWLRQVVDQNLFSEGERATKSLAANRYVCCELVVDAVDEFDWCSCTDSHGGPPS